MKRWSGQLFPITLLVLLAGLSVWLERTVDLPEGRHDGKTRHDPDAIVEKLELRRLDVDGQLQYRLTAPRLEHFPDDDSSLITAPRLTYLRADKPSLILTGQRGLATSKGETVFFWGDVTATREANAQRAALVARMPDLTVQPDEGYAFTQSPVEVTQGRSLLKGVGMTLDNTTSVFTLQSQVKGLYYPQKSPTP